MSAPHASGAAALLESFDPNLTGPQKFNLIVNNTTPYTDTRDLGSGILNANNALQALGPPTPPTNVTAQAQTQNHQVLLNWTASARAEGYRIYYQENTPGPPFDPCHPGNPANGADVGDVTEIMISGLTPGMTYYFAVTAYDALGESDYSTPASATPGSSSKVIISGYVRTISGYGIEAVEVTARNGGGSTLTDPNGHYQLEVPWGWTKGAVTPAKNRWTFDPNRLEYPGPITEDQLTQNFTGWASADFNLSGSVDVADLAFFVRYWLETDCQNINWCHRTDLDLSTKVDLIDYALFTRRWLKINK